jgi:hypothetical protein
MTLRRQNAEIFVTVWSLPLKQPSDVVARSSLYRLRQLNLEFSWSGSTHHIMYYR